MFHQIESPLYQLGDWLTRVNTEFNLHAYMRALQLPRIIGACAIDLVGSHLSFVPQRGKSYIHSVATLPDTLTLCEEAGTRDYTPLNVTIIVCLEAPNNYITHCTSELENESSIIRRLNRS